jgi:hypothetical protein
VTIINERGQELVLAGSVIEIADPEIGASGSISGDLVISK